MPGPRPRGRSRGGAREGAFCGREKAGAAAGGGAGRKGAQRCLPARACAAAQGSTCAQCKGGCAMKERATNRLQGRQGMTREGASFSGRARALHCTRARPARSPGRAATPPATCSCAQAAHHTTPHRHRHATRSRHRHGGQGTVRPAAAECGKAAARAQARAGSHSRRRQFDWLGGRGGGGGADVPSVGGQVPARAPDGEVTRH